MTRTHELMTGLRKAWNAGDGAAWAGHFAADAEFVDVLGRIQHGREVIAREHQKVFDTIYHGSRLDLRELSSRPLTDGVLLVHTTSALLVPAGPRAGETHAIQTKIVRDGLILAFHNTIRSQFAVFAEGDEALAHTEPLDWDGQR
ncbi:DUF4440 domain-containing protein [Amycolatopsis antarctica]|uniref:DUF4440 domain-containing protein n=1 Tax=Amycolatopsis antarctica TaxID=1854586 RepID=A0A263D694_9PSEU|nr:SgcJ/EcaC family oxidoreductase [Amycolatopsis antarctica]OZM73891.1 DUF4440 domain-containing protein [Amycolatopsis antarctica]